MKQAYVYIMTNQYRTTFYIGVTNDIAVRVWQHLNEGGSKFVKRYHCFDLVYYEHHMRVTDAIDREKQLKNWHRDWKINLIKTTNPDMRDLKPQIGT
ncbi:MAG: GIY-YIG nuclease family protein [Mucilaginibacter sp.]|uniref:GIY-YIG nuclease family protein n=1 Tax=Mucilaginibacter sp. TaxID=1882438 RepID=UPI00326735C7